MPRQDQCLRRLDAKSRSVHMVKQRVIAVRRTSDLTTQSTTAAIVLSRSYFQLISRLHMSHMSWYLLQLLINSHGRPISSWYCHCCSHHTSHFVDLALHTRSARGYVITQACVGIHVHPFRPYFLSQVELLSHWPLPRFVFSLKCTG